ncbi:hypothetical protein KP509_20G073700 [Ceratopteris richardii]|uniref:Uncharacterized protein n=1 Tax=Ceratopteris richardii TaxID=49495 RepID=A0A8T2SI53_CERRI|nr:hypothetical protein KP509_20G073700 [Ceratopteris richardii]
MAKSGAMRETRENHSRQLDTKHSCTVRDRHREPPGYDEAYNRESSGGHTERERQMRGCCRRYWCVAGGEHAEREKGHRVSELTTAEGYPSREPCCDRDSWQQSKDREMDVRVEESERERVSLPPSHGGSAHARERARR